MCASRRNIFVGSGATPYNDRSGRSMHDVLDLGTVVYNLAGASDANI